MHRYASTIYVCGVCVCESACERVSVQCGVCVCEREKATERERGGGREREGREDKRGGAGGHSVYALLYMRLLNMRPLLRLY